MKYFFLLSLTCVTLCGTGQNELVGRWRVDQVSVGAEVMTPVAKWFHLYDNATLHSGNGGIINTRGRWELQEDGFLPYNENNQPDPAGPFRVVREANSMTWTRAEEGQTVTVKLSRIALSDLPPALWDQILGSWQIVSNTISTEDPEALPFERLYFRWDNLVNINFGTELPRRRSIWRIAAHQPILQLIPEAPEQPRSSWTIAIEGERMTWRNVDASREQTLIWRRMEE